MTTITASATPSRSQKRSLIAAPSQSIGFRPAKPSLEAVPPLDRVLADAPAEEHVLALPHRREVEQARRPASFTCTPSSVERVEAALELGRGGGELVGARLADRVAAAVPGDDLHDLALLALELLEPGPHGDHPLGERAHLGEGAVSLGRSEGAGHEGELILGVSYGTHGAATRGRLIAWSVLVVGS